ncbi:hypothetical protein C8J56DRAFT_1054866 [Mycena floridula]|nr:hypothetical protein C8J56DRAFT_1054866 [Mycena floridula]
MTFSLVLLTTNRAPNVVDGLRPGTGTSMVHMPVPEGRTRKGLIIEIIVALVPSVTIKGLHRAHLVVLPNLTHALEFVALLLWNFAPKTLNSMRNISMFSFSTRSARWSWTSVKLAINPLLLNVTVFRNRMTSCENKSLDLRLGSLVHLCRLLRLRAQSASPSSDRVIRNLPRPRILPNQPFPGISPNFAGNFIAPQNSVGLADRISAPRLAMRLQNSEGSSVTRVLPDDSPLSPGYVAPLNAHDVDRMMSNSRHQNEAGRYANRTLNMFMVDAKATPAERRSPTMNRVIERDFSTTDWYRPGYQDINSDAAEKARLRTLAKKIASCPNEVDWTQHSAARAAEILLFSAPTCHQVLGVLIIRDATNIRLTKISIAAARGARLAYLTCPSGDDESRRYLVAFAELTSHSGFYAEFLITNKITLPPKAESLMRFMPRAGSSSISAFDVAGHLSGLGVPIMEIDDAFSFGLNIVISQIGGESIRLNDFGLEFWQPLLTESANSLVNKERPKMLDGPEFLFVGDRTFMAVHRHAFPTGVKPKSRICGARKVTAPPEELKESNNMVIDSPTRNLMEITLAENAFANSGFDTEVFNFDFGSADRNFGEPSQHWGAGPVLSLT